MTNEQLTILFGSKTRVKLLRHFLADPEQKYYVRELTRILNDHINAIRHELGNLENAHMVTKKKSQGKLYYRLNQEVHGMTELKELFTEPPAPEPEPEPQPVFGTKPAPPKPELGDIQLLVHNGKFVNNAESPADILVVGEIDDDLFKPYIKKLEAKHGDVRYTVMSEDEFEYRRKLFDRFITLMLSEPKKVIINHLRDRALAKA